MPRDYQAELLQIEKERLARNEAIQTEGQTERDRLEAASKEFPEHAALYSEAIAESKTRDENYVAANDKLAAGKANQVEADRIAEQESIKETALVPPPPVPGAAPETSTQTYETNAQWGQAGGYEVPIQLPPGGGEKGPEPIDQIEQEQLTYTMDQRGQMFGNAASVADQTAQSGQAADFVVGAAVLGGFAAQQVQSFIKGDEKAVDAAVNAPQRPELAAQNQATAEIEAADRAKPAAAQNTQQSEPKPQPSVEQQNTVMEEFRTAPPPPKPEPLPTVEPGNDYVI